MLGPKNTAAEVAGLLEEGLRSGAIFLRRPEMAEGSLGQEVASRQSARWALVTAFGFLGTGLMFLIGDSVLHVEELVHLAHLDKVANFTDPDKITALARAFIEVAAFLFGGYEVTRIFKGRVGR